MTTQDANNLPQEIDGADLDRAHAGFQGSTFSNLKPKLTTLFYNEGLPSHKIVYAQASGSGNVTGNGGAPAPRSYTFGEDLGDDIIPVTYKLDN